ncbi:MAG: hypothetical protein WD249_07485 [Gaiellaceae bacterium]
MADNRNAKAWTIRTVDEPKRGRVTAKTVKQLSGDKSLRGVKTIAKKYASG